MVVVQRSEFRVPATSSSRGTWARSALNSFSSAAQRIGSSKPAIVSGALHKYLQAWATLVVWARLVTSVMSISSPLNRWVSEISTSSLCRPKMPMAEGFRFLYMRLPFCSESKLDPRAFRNRGRAFRPPTSSVDKTSHYPGGGRTHNPTTLQLGGQAKD